MIAKKKIAIGIIVIVVVALIVILLKYYKKKKLEAVETGGSSSGTGSGNTTPSGSGSGSNTSNASPTFPLKKGSKGEEVKALQKALNKYVAPPMALLEVDGDFGSKTENLLFSKFGVKEVTEANYNKLIGLNNPFGI